MTNCARGRSVLCICEHHQLVSLLATHICFVYCVITAVQSVRITYTFPDHIQWSATQQMNSRKWSHSHSCYSYISNSTCNGPIFNCPFPDEDLSYESKYWFFLLNIFKNICGFSFFECIVSSPHYILRRPYHYQTLALSVDFDHSSSICTSGLLLRHIFRCREVAWHFNLVWPGVLWFRPLQVVSRTN